MNIGKAAALESPDTSTCTSTALGRRRDFISVIGETRVLPETLDMTWERIRKAFAIDNL